tara:strand:+ start:1290 stop:1412 length:123 start_codon:yes stop_codon:yes gene_type:complete
MTGLEMLKDLEIKLNHIKEVIPEATSEERQEILLRYYSRI